MTNQKDTGGAAFPRPVSEDRGSGDQPDGNSTVSEQDGMSLRDYFAGQALMGLMANSSMVEILRKGFRPDNAAEACYATADAMVAQRNRRD